MTRRHRDSESEWMKRIRQRKCQSSNSQDWNSIKTTEQEQWIDSVTCQGYRTREKQNEEKSGCNRIGSDNSDWKYSPRILGKSEKRNGWDWKDHEI